MPKFEPFDRTDHIVEITDGTATGATGLIDRMVTVSHVDAEFRNRVQTSFRKWLTDGVGCRLLRLGSDKWVRGVLRFRIEITLEFKPNEGQGGDS